jgi:hypothetical protein
VRERGFEASEKIRMAEAKLPEGRDEQEDAARVRKLALVGVEAYLLLSVALWWALDQYLDARPPMTIQYIAPAVLLIMVGLAEVTAVIYYSWRLRQATRESPVIAPISYPEANMPTNDKETELIWNFYIEMGLVERHFNQIQSGYRTLASTWMLGAFAAIGFVLATEFSLPIPRELLVAAIGIAASIGVGLIWVLDLLINQRLLDASFIQSRALETTHRWLPQIRNTMRTLLRGRALRLVLLFYVVGTEVMALIGGAGLLLWLNSTRAPVVLVFLVALNYVIGMLLVLVFMDLKTSTTGAYEGTPPPSGARSGTT